MGLFSGIASIFGGGGGKQTTNVTQESTNVANVQVDTNIQNVIDFDSLANALMNGLNALGSSLTSGFNLQSEQQASAAQTQANALASAQQTQSKIQLIGAMLNYDAQEKARQNENMQLAGILQSAQGALQQLGKYGLIAAALVAGAIVYNKKRKRKK